MRWDPWEEAAKIGIDVVESPGFPVGGLYLPDLPVIVIDTAQPHTRQRCALAEELAHHILGHRPHPCPTETARLEHRARTWAARTLMPAGLLKQHLNGDPLADTAEQLEVTERLLRWRLETMHEHDDLSIPRR